MISVGILPIKLKIPRSRWPDRSDLWSDHLRTHTCSRCAQITWSGEDFKRTFVWTMAWNLSDQRWLQSTTVGPEAVLSAHLSDKRPIRAYTNLIRGRFEAIVFRVFFNDRDCLSQESTIQQHSDNRPIESLMGWSETRGPAECNCRSPYQELWNSCRSKRYYAKLSKFIYSVKNMN